MSDYAGRGLTSRFTLPFATLAANRLKDFTKDMEMAAIVYLAESSRKSESRLLKKPDEKLVFIAEVSYPLWLIPYNRATLLFDGLGITSHTLAWDMTPDTEIFARDIRESRKTTEAYVAALARNSDYFESFTGREEESIDALIAIPDLVEDLTAYFAHMEELREPSPANVVLTPIVCDSGIQASLRQLSSLQQQTGRDIEGLQAGMKLLNAATAERVTALREDIRGFQVTYDKQTAKAKAKVTRDIAQVRRQYGRDITQASREYKKKLQRLRQAQVRLQKTLRHLSTEAKRCEVRIRSGNRRRKKQKVTRWTLQLKRVKKKRPTLESELKDTVKRMRKLESAQRLNAARQKAECDSRVETANKTLQDLQASKAADITWKRQEISAMEATTARITAHMLVITRTKRAYREKLGTLAMFGRRQTAALVYVPFYLVRYETDDARRYVVYSPSIVGDLGTVTRMKGALGLTRMNALLRPRSHALAAFLNQFVTLLERNPMLEQEVTEAGIQRSILLTRQLRMDVRKGLRELETEEWISPDELEGVSELLYTYV